jgi:hypothetical protein
MNTTIGIDFDNTIVSYDDLIHRAAVDRGLVDVGAGRSKRALRDRIRQLADGEIEWQKLQAVVYGPLMRDARLIDGAAEFVRCCRDAGILVCVVSHKTEYANYDVTQTNLRTEALEWMAAHGFFDRRGLALDRSNVYFESTRDQKIFRIRSIGCTHFIDDLEEVFLEPSFPPGVQKILYAPDAAGVSGSGAIVMRSWQAVRDYFFSGLA